MLVIRQLLIQYQDNIFKTKRGLISPIANPNATMRISIFFIILSAINFSAYSQKSDPDFYLSLSAGNFTIGHGYIKGIWAGVEGSKSLSKSNKKFLNKLKVGGELYFENGADKATVYNPTVDQFRHELYYHESNTGLAAKLNYHPFGGFMKGLRLAGGPLIVYSIRTFERRAQLIQYGPDVFVRMSEIGYESKLLGGYRITVGYTIDFGKKWLAGIRADFEQYHSRDLNSLIGVTAGYHF